MIDPQNRVPLYPGRVTMTPVSGQANTYDMERADQPTQEGTPLNRDTLRKLQADIRTYPIASGQSISAGDVVDIDENGELVQTVTAEKNKEIVILQNNSSYITATKLNDDQVLCIVSYTDQINYSTAILVDAESGERIKNNNFPGGVNTLTSCARLNDTKFIAGWAFGLRYHAVVGQVSGDSITYGSNATVSTTSSADEEVFLVALDENRAAFVGVFSGQLKVVVLSIDGTTITAGQEYPVSNGSGIGNISATLLPDDSSGNKRICVCFSKELSGYKGSAIIVSIDSNNAVTLGTEIAFDESNINSLSCTSRENLIVVAYAVNAVGYVIPLTANGNSLTIGTRVQFWEQAYHPAICTLSDRFLLAYARGIGGYAVIISENNGALTSGEQYQYNLPETERISVVTTSNNQVIVAYKDVGNNSYGTTTVLKVRGTQIAGSFTTNSTQAIALQSGTAGQSIEVIFSGTTAADWATVGKEITSEGVYGFAPVGGFLNVIPWWSKNAGLNMVTGKVEWVYPNTNSRTVELGFKPKVVLIITDYNNMINFQNSDLAAKSSVIVLTQDFINNYSNYYYGYITETGFMLPTYSYNHQLDYVLYVAFY